MLDITLFNEALKVSWIKKYLDPENNGKWKCSFDFQLEKFGGNALPKGNLNLKDIKNLKISDSFVKEIFEIWSEVCFEGTITSDDHFLSSPLWHNSLMRIQNKPVLYNDWISKGITQVKHLLDDSCSFLSLQAFQNKYDFQVRPLSFFGVISAVNRLRRPKTKTQIKHEFFWLKLLKTQKPSQLVYQKLVFKKSEKPISSQEKWKKDTISGPNNSFNWKTVSQTSFKCTRNSKFIYFDFKFLHRRLATNSFSTKNWN